MLAGVFGRGEIRDPALADVVITVTEVRIGPDLKRATAFVTRLGRSDVAEKLRAIAAARGADLVEALPLGLDLRGLRDPQLACRVWLREETTDG